MQFSLVLLSLLFNVFPVKTSTRSRIAKSGIFDSCSSEPCFCRRFASAGIDDPGFDAPNFLAVGSLFPLHRRPTTKDAVRVSESTLHETIYNTEPTSAKYVKTARSTKTGLKDGVDAVTGASQRVDAVTGASPKDGVVSKQ